MGTTEGTETTEEPGTWGRPELVHEELTGAIRQTAFDVHNYFGNGFLEKVYENALAHRLQGQGLRVGMLLNFGQTKLQVQRLVL